MNGHRPVLSQETIEFLQPRPGAVFIDCTLGGGGHARSLLERIRPGGRLLGLDRDPEALDRVRERLGGWEGLTLRRGDFADLTVIAAESGFEGADGVLFDVGVSSQQLDDPRRGFSFRSAGPLDMRMDPASALSAEEVVNTTSEANLARIIRELGEERWAGRIARFVVRRRPLTTTFDLAAAVAAAVPRGAWPPGTHPATRTFQAIRMTVNDELGSLERGLKAATKILTPGGRMATICFHSLEDRLVKSHFNVESHDCVCPPQQPVCTCAHRASLRVVTRRPVRPSAGEIRENPRARSARLRVAEKLQEKVS
ncbi:MAG: 16S rRNA (cytosine(1402)-N(4))-methyltransferase RsmH [Candidatus Dormibacteraceae bacterium]